VEGVLRQSLTKRLMAFSLILATSEPHEVVDEWRSSLEPHEVVGGLFIDFGHVRDI
jgi:hypothetical protein